jgi:linoleoyl-CoA desaturase
MEKEKRIKFLNHHGENFLSAVRRKVDNYFHQTGKSRNATWQHHVKVLFLFACWLSLYAIILEEVFSPIILLGLAMVLGMVTGILGINISHDAAHGSYSSHPKMNKLLGYSYDLIGFSSYVWRITHNGGHHTYTNIAGHDPDIDKPVLLRLTPQSPWLWFHVYQNWYIWLLYSFVSLNWVFISDYVYFFKEKNPIPLHERCLFFIFKAINVFIFIGLPMLVMSLPWWQILIGYCALQMVGGFTVALIFQLAHIVENAGFPEPDEQGVVHNQWAVHELVTTANFGTHSAFLSHLLGGLNFQVEHHLFPHIAHSHYRSISAIVRETAEEFNLPYHENKTMAAAIASHWRLLKKLGQKPH